MAHSSGLQRASLGSCCKIVGGGGRRFGVARQVHSARVTVLKPP